MEDIQYNFPLWLNNNNFATRTLFRELNSTPSIYEEDVVDRHTLKTNLTNKLKSLKSQFENYQHHNIQTAHKKINHFEKIGNLFFQNRAAIKLLNINADIGYALSRTHFNLSEDEVFFFADLCGGVYNIDMCVCVCVRVEKHLCKLFVLGPGGFAEYLLYDNKLYSKGYGISLVEQCDYNLDVFNIQSYKECFSPIYGPAGNGDITQFQNQEYFIKSVIKDTNNLGVHVVCADGGFSVHDDEIFQEHLSLELYLCQCFVGLSVLRDDGIFVCKFFDLYTNFSVSLIYLLYSCFKEITIYKPITSRPGNSERYFIGRGLKSIDKTQPIYSYILYLINNRAKLPPLHRLQLLPWSVLDNDAHFMDYYKARLHEIENTQIIAIKNIFQQLQKISPPQHKTIPIDYLLSFWNLHYNTKPSLNFSQNNSFKHPNQIFNSIVHPYDGDVILNRFIPSEKTHDWYNIHFSNNSVWHFIKLCESANTNDLNCTLYSCFIKAIVHNFVNGKWIYNNLNINLPLNTIVLAVLVKNTLYILDVVMIDGKNLLDFSFEQRQKKIKLLIKVISNISDGAYYENFIQISCVDFIQDIPSNHISLTDNQNKFKKHLYLAINDKSLVDKCLFYK